MRLLHHGEDDENGAWSWFFRVIPDRDRASQMVVCGSMLVSHTDQPPVRAETVASAAHRAAPLKLAGDLLVSGRAWPGGGRAAPAMRVGVAMGGWRKELAVFGDRLWEIGAAGLAATRPLPFESMPVSYDRAFGGAGSRWNPDGRGMGGGDRGALLPNIERLDRLIQTPTARPEPAGFGPIDPYWRPRSDRLGSFDANWLSKQWPGMPDDFNLQHWNEAPEDQQFPGWFRGDERIAVFNMHPEQSRVDIALPGRRGRAFLAAADGGFAELPLRLDTISVDMEAECTELVWRGAVPVRSPRLREIAFLFTTVDDLDAPLGDGECRARFEQLRRETFPTAEELRAEEGDDDDDREDAEEQAREDREVAAITAETEILLANAKRQAAEEGAATSSGDGGMAASIAVLREHDPAKADEIAALWAGAQAALGPEEAGWTRERVARAHQDGAAMDGADLSGLDLGRLRLDGAGLAGADLANARLAGSTLRGADLAGANLAGVDATDADFTTARLAGASFAGAIVTGAIFVNADLTGAELSGLHAPELRFDGVHGADAEFGGAMLDGASFAGATLTGADFVGASLLGASFDGAELSRADLGGAAASGASFREAEMVNLRANEADLRGAVLTGVQAPDSVFIQARLEGADLKRAVLSGAIFSEATLDDADLDRAWLDNAKFDEASLRGAKLTRCKLVRASLERADLTDADLTGSNLYNAGLFAADCTRLRLDGCFLTGTLLAP